MDNRFERILFTHEQIVERTKELAEIINTNYKDANKLTLVGLMKGSIPFLAELMKHIKVDMLVDFMTISSYFGGMESTGNLKIITDLAHNISGKDVIIVEDIVDSGLTMKKVCDLLKSRNPKSLSICALLDKPSKRKHEVKIDMVGFEIEDVFVAGFGLDVKGKLRNIPYIGVFNKNKLEDI